MIEGLRLLPQVQSQRDDAEGSWYLTCDDCDRYNDRATKRVFRCGWLPEKERTGGMGAYPGSTVCPGYTTSLPDVYETARALSWRRDGQIRELYDVPLTQLLRDCVDVLDSACKQSDRERLAEQRRRMESQR